MPADLKIPEDLQDRLVYDEVDGFLFWRDQSITEEEAQRVLSLSQDPDYQRAASEIIELLRSDTTSLTALQLLTQVSNNENQLRDLERGLQDQQDAFKTQLGLPPDVGLEIDTSLLRPFELISPKLSATEAELQTVLTIVDRPLGQPADFSALRTFLSRLEVLAEQVTTNGFEQVQEEFKPVQELLDTGKSAATKRVFINDAEVERVRKDFARDKRLFSIARSEFDRAVRDLDRLMLLVDGDTAAAAFRKLDKDMDGKIEMQELDGVFDASLLKRLDINEDGEASVAELVDIVEAISRDIREEILRSAQSLQVLQAGLRTELVAVNRFTLNGSEETPTIHEVVKVALENRLDLMNSRAAVMDARRRLEIAANALESTLDIQVDGQLGTPPGGRNPFDFRQDQSRLDVGIQFTTPLDQIQERNDYAASLITYQRARRDYMRIEDQVKTQIRTSWRQLQVSEQQLEIDRQQIRQAALQFDNAAQQAARGGQNNALNLLNSIGALLNAQNRLIGDWIRYELNRLNIYRDMGIMEIDPRGIWTDEFYQQGQNFPAEPGLNPPSDTAPPLLNLDRDSIDEPKSDDVPPAPQASRGVDALDHVGYRVAGNRRHRGSSRGCSPRRTPADSVTSSLRTSARLRFASR